jgi:hypothetical protein
MDEDDLAACAFCDLSARLHAELTQARVAARAAEAQLVALDESELTRQEWLARWRTAQQTRANESVLNALLHDMHRAHGACHATPA